MTSEQDEGEYEDIYVYAKLNGPHTLAPESHIHVMGIEKEQPIIQVDKQVFIGKHGKAIGTYLLFADNRGTIVPITNTARTLTLDRAYISPKMNIASSSSQMPESTSMKTETPKLEIEKVHSLTEGVLKVVAAKPWRVVETPNIAYRIHNESPTPELEGSTATVVEPQPIQSTLLPEQAAMKMEMDVCQGQSQQPS